MLKITKLAKTPTFDYERRHIDLLVALCIIKIYFYCSSIMFPDFFFVSIQRKVIKYNFFIDKIVNFTMKLRESQEHKNRRN